jgi:hypothetical protein
MGNRSSLDIVEKVFNSNVSPNANPETLDNTDIYKYIFVNLPSVWSIKMKQDETEFVMSPNEPISSLTVVNGLRCLSRNTGGKFEQVHLDHDGICCITNDQIGEEYRTSLGVMLQMLNGDKDPIFRGQYKSK